MGFIMKMNADIWGSPSRVAMVKEEKKIATAKKHAFTPVKDNSQQAIKYRIALAIMQGLKIK